MNHRQQWALFSPAGLVLVGLGLSLTGEAGRRKNADEPWLLLGTLGLACVNAGIALVAEGVKHRTLFELGQDEDRRLGEAEIVPPVGNS